MPEVSTLSRTLSSAPYFLRTTVLSVDDLYLPHSTLRRLSSSHPENPLLRHRGVPSTHDVPLAASVFSALRARLPTSVPSYDKSAYSGQGDRMDPETWERVNEPGEAPVEVVIFEGWCVGFRALEEEELTWRWEEARTRQDETSQLAKCALENVRFVNEALRTYDELTGDAEHLTYVYAWRLEQEAALRAAKGSGMTDDQVREFVNDYYPCYELYTPALRHPPPPPGREGQVQAKNRPQLHLVIGKDRAVKTVEMV
ncbi:MAG: hypothetical protein M1837_006385 [Sclerophora amabilis]|nr:MAG: hypothetical protein M1837_006385 [Sclerophora amabilis]